MKGILIITIKLQQNRKIYKYYFIVFNMVESHPTRKMKQKLSITIDGKTIKLIEGSIKEGLFRNRSHVVEFSVNKILKEKKENGQN